MADSPAKLGYRMPAEWECHEATWIAWPHNKDDWPGKFGPIPWVFVEVVRRLHQSERIRILVQGPHTEKQARESLELAGADMSRIEFYSFRTNRVWTRDSGPTFIVGPHDELALIDWRFNAWAKYPNWRHDDALPAKIGRALDLKSWRPKVKSQRVVLEGGSIDVNGQGILLTTEECLLGEVQQRNPGLSREDLEKTLVEHLGVKKILWLNRGIVGDDTHGHIDDLARFVGLHTVVTMVEPNPADENHLPLQENLDRLRGMTDLDGRHLDVVPLPMPGPVWWDGNRLPASYANFYIANDCVLVPTFNDPNDRRALGILGDLFPAREVMGIHAVDLVWGLGTLHCMTQQQPMRRQMPLGGK